MMARLLRFGCVGALATAVQYAALLVLVRGVGFDPVLASSIGFCLSLGLNYALNYRFTFRSNQRHHATVSRFASLAAIGFLLNTVIVTLLADLAGIHYVVAQLVATAAVFAWNFLGNEYWTFRVSAAR